MKLDIRIITAFILCLSPSVFGQRAKLEGKVVDDRNRVVPNVRIIVAAGQSASTDSRGHFSITFPDSVRPGRATRIQVARPNWVVYQPTSGKCDIQDADNFEPLVVMIVPNGSPLALSPARISEVVREWVKERIKLKSKINDLGGQLSALHGKLDEYAFLEEYAKYYGFTLDRFKTAAQQWAQIKESDDKEARALKEYWLNNYALAAQLAEEGAVEANVEFERASQEKLEAGRKIIDGYMLASRAKYQREEFGDALKPLVRLDQYFLTGELSKEEWSADWAELRLMTGEVKLALSETVEGTDGSKLLRDAITEFERSALAYPQGYLSQWIFAQENLGEALLMLSQQVPPAEGLKYAKRAVAIFRGASEVFTANDSPIMWTRLEGDLALALTRCSEFVSGSDSVRY